MDTNWYFEPCPKFAKSLTLFYLFPKYLDTDSKEKSYKISFIGGGFKSEVKQKIILE